MIKPFRRNLQITLLFCGVFAAAMSLCAGLTQKHVYADNLAPKLPLVWADDKHSYVADSNGVQFTSAGYLCLDSGTRTFTGSGATVTVGDDPQTNSDDSAVVSTSTILDSIDYNTKFALASVKPQAGKVTDYCGSTSKAPAYAWVTRHSSGTNYAFIVNSCYGSQGGISSDAQAVAVRSAITTQNTSTCAWIAPIGSDGHADVGNQIGTITDMKIDPTLAAQGITSDDQNENSGTGNACHIPGDLAWIECPVMNAMNWFALKVDGIIATLLEINTKVVFDQSGNYYKVWNNFRIIAVGLIVVAGLIMVFGQALGLEVMDAYTIRKVLPRLLIVAIGMTLSWPLLEFVVTFFNNMGNWVGDILTAPFGNVAQVSYQSLMATFMGTAAVGLGGTALAITAYASGTLTAEGIMALIGTLCLSMLVALITLTVRNMIVIVALISAPIAIACYILPGTQKVWKIWKDALVTSLLMFPIVEAFLSAGKVLASVSFSGAGGGTNNSMGFIGLLAYAAPYFLLPMAFKMAGGLIGNLTGQLENRSKGAFGKLRKKRQEATKTARKEIKEGTRWNENSVIGRSKLGGIVRYGNRRGRRSNLSRASRIGGVFSSTQRGANEAAMSNSGIASASAMAQADPNFNAQMPDEEAMVAHALGNDRDRMAQLQYFQQRDTDGNLVHDMDGALTRSRTIDMSQRSQTAAGEALAMSGKVIKNREEAAMVIKTMSRGNATMEKNLTNSMRKTWREHGRNDIGRGTDVESLREMSTSNVSALNPIAAGNLFGREVDDNGNVTREAGVLNAMHQTDSDDQRRHYVDLLHSAQNSTQTTAEQQGQIAQAVAGLRADATYGDAGQDLWGKHMADYNEKMGRTPPP